MALKLKQVWEAINNQTEYLLHIKDILRTWPRGDANVDCNFHKFNFNDVEKISNPDDINISSHVHVKNENNIFTARVAKRKKQI